MAVSRTLNHIKLIAPRLLRSLTICSTIHSQSVKQLFVSKRSAATSMSSPDQIKYLNQEEAINLDKELFNDFAFSVDQLMELAGLSVASVIAKCYPKPNHNKPVICCGPGNNGGDGLVCARHLKLFGYEPVVVCPKPGRGQLYQNLLIQCRKFNITVIPEVPKQPLSELGNLLVDSIFGFSFKPPNRNPDLARLLNIMHEESLEMPLISVDIPSGWHVETGDANIEQDQAEIEPELRLPALKPDCLISLTGPKKCAKSFKGRHHYLGGRFVPDSIVKKYDLYYPRETGQFEAVKLN